MRIYTSYFANLKKIKVGVTPIDISRFPPKWLAGQLSTCRMLAPSEQLVLDCKAGRVSSSAEYESRYYSEVLNELDPQEVVDTLEKLSEGNEVAILCYEVPGAMCHRRHVADWLENTLGYVVDEYPNT